MRLHRSIVAMIYISLILFFMPRIFKSLGEIFILYCGVSPLALRVTSHQLPNGIEVSSGNLSIKVTALRNDVLRVTLYRGGAFAEDASWAVLPEARKSSVPVTFDLNSNYFGFRTRQLAVEVDESTLQLTIRDLNGNLLQQDARPLRFDGDAFRIYKTMPLNEHYFGLGDKTGPLDRRNGAFTLWNTGRLSFSGIHGSDL